MLLAVNSLVFKGQFHRAWLQSKLICPICKNSSAFYTKDGIKHHYRMVHKNEICHETCIKAGELMLREKHAEEIKETLLQYSDARREVSIPIIKCVTLEMKD